jgi:hypothetical protein
LFSQSAVPKKMAILPFNAIGVDETSAQTAESILRLEIGKLSAVDIVSEKRMVQNVGADTCADLNCAVEIGRNLDADQVVLCKLARLGEKIIVQYFLADVSTQKLIIEDRMTAVHVEDLDEVMKRVAASLVKSESAEKTAEVGVITEQETQTPRRRTARKTSGFSFGYLYPRHGYDDSKRSFAMDFRTGAELQNVAVGMQLFIRKGFGMNIFTSYLFSKKDVCPYLGGAFGFHWVSHDHYSDYYYTTDGYYQEREKKEDDGFELNLDAGVRLFHTYNFQIIVNLGYSYTINDYDDQAVLFTFGLLR